MDFSSEGLLCRAKSVVSCFNGILLWALRLPSRTQSPKQKLTHHEQFLQMGLKTLMASQEEPPRSRTGRQNFILHSYMKPSSSPSAAAAPPPPSPSSSSKAPLLFGSLSSWSLVMEDLIGTENGAYTSPSEEQMLVMNKPELSHNLHDARQKRRSPMKREYPPLIPLLARTGNLPGRMPWVLRRRYGNGKLTLTVERVKHHEYFEAYRENGRLILNLVPMDDSIGHCPYQRNEDVIEQENFEETMEMEGYPEEAQIQENQESEADDDNIEDNEVLLDDHPTLHERLNIVSSSSMPQSCFQISEHCGELRKCFVLMQVK